MKDIADKLNLLAAFNCSANVKNSDSGILERAQERNEQERSWRSRPTAKKKNKLVDQKRAQMWETLIPWIIAVGGLVLFVLLYMALSGDLGNMGEYIKAFLGIGR